MIKFLFLLLIFAYNNLWAQDDGIILPDLELIIEDQSSLKTVQNTEEAILRERNPQFQDVYLEELSATIADASLNSAITQRDNNRLSYVQFSYGSFNNSLIEAYSQNLINNLFYRISYQGQFHDNVTLHGNSIPNTKFYKNILDIYFSYALPNTIFDVGLSYEQHKNSFFNNPLNNQHTHYIPIYFDTKYWVNDISHIDVLLAGGFTVLEFQDLEGIKNKDTLFVDSKLSLDYKANHTDWNYLELGVNYEINDYEGNTLSHLASLRLVSDFLLPKGFSIRMGATLIGSSLDTVYGWPEFSFNYDYLGRFSVSLKMTGDYNLYNAQKASKEEQLFSLDPSPESRWIYALSLRVFPSPYFWMEGAVEYSDYQNKRIYEYNPSEKLYSFIQSGKVGVLASKISLGSEVNDIFDLKASYVYEDIPKDWLLYSPHMFELVIGLGYAPVGFRFETTLILYGRRLLTDTEEVALSPLLNFKVSQKVTKVAELFIELNNVLNQDIQYISGKYYGGIQAYGGVKLNF